MNRTRSGWLFRLILLTFLLTALLTTAYRLAQATLIDFEQPPLGGEPRQIVDPYVCDGCWRDLYCGHTCQPDRGRGVGKK